jgi:hypothetical protein
LLWRRLASPCVLSTAAATARTEAWLVRPLRETMAA